ncbi:MAG: PHP domain-containing protein [Syntrophobacterales bacterium]|nr:MAG: PHP domain-containing protein [Syntrophobacterales bacterium]
MIDLHIHTTASSDGQHSPEEIFEKAREFKFEAIAFADHNSVGSVEEGLRISRGFEIEFIPCIEINTHYKGYDFHLLGYFIDHRDKGLLQWLKGLKGEKRRQIRQRVGRLRKLGFTISVEDVERYSAGREPTGVSYLKALLERGENRENPRVRVYIDGERSGSPYLNFYLDYLAGGKPASIPVRFIPTPEAIRLVRSFGGIPVLAHPSEAKDYRLFDLIGAGLEGLEVYSSYHREEDEQYFRKVCDQYGLLETAGSDFHGKEIKPDVPLGELRGASYDLVEKLRWKKRTRDGQLSERLRISRQP